MRVKLLILIYAIQGTRGSSTYSFAAESVVDGRVTQEFDIERIDGVTFVKDLRNPSRVLAFPDSQVKVWEPYLEPELVTDPEETAPATPIAKGKAIRGRK